MKTEKDNDGRGPEEGGPGKGNPKPSRPPEEFKIRIDKDNHSTEDANPTGRQLLALAGKSPPERFQIFLRGKGGDLEPVPLDQEVDLSRPGVERFVTLPLDQTEGAPGSAPRRDFALPEGDTEFLDALGLKWETIVEGRVARLVVRDYPVPEGYGHRCVDLNLRIEPNYPETRIDMAYVHPHLAKLDGRRIGALSTDSFEGKQWQRWSRHRTAANPWRPGVDDVATHLALVDHWFGREIAKAA